MVSQGSFNPILELLQLMSRQDVVAGRKTVAGKGDLDSEDVEAREFWVANGTPDDMDADLDGIPCETVYGLE